MRKGRKKDKDCRTKEVERQRWKRDSCGFHGDEETHNRGEECKEREKELR